MQSSLLLLTEYFIFLYSTAQSGDTKINFFIIKLLLSASFFIYHFRRVSAGKNAANPTRPTRNLPHTDGRKKSTTLGSTT